MKKDTWQFIFPAIVVLVIIASASGLFVKDLYTDNSAQMAVKFRSNDLAILTLIIPLSVVMLILAYTGRFWARVFLLGIIATLAFTFGITLFNGVQNRLFLLYLAVLGICAFGLARGFPELIQQVETSKKSASLRVASVAVLFISVAGYYYWLSEAVAALISGGPSTYVQGMNLPVNAAQALDMAFMLPLAIYGGIKLWKYRADGLIITAVMLVFFLLIGVSVVIMEIGLIRGAGLEMDFGKISSYSFVTLLSFIATLFIYSSLSKAESKG
jgi:hypothetical protein